MEVLGRYQIERKLGAGGMGEVYLAQDSLLGRRVALKRVHPAIVRDEQAKARFLREARALAGLNHPNIAILYEVGEADGLPFLVMEYIDGKSLRDEVARGPLLQERLLEIACQIAAAIEHAHSHGILHRDIKSSNILLTRDGIPKVCDFGLAKFVESGQETRSELTAAGEWLGTLQYAAPEGLSGQPADQAADIYSLGVVLYEMACGRTPFHDLKGAALAAAIMQGHAPPLGERNPALPEELERVIAKAMAYRPRERFSSVAELRGALLGQSPGAPITGSGSISSSRTTLSPSIAVLDFSSISGDAASDWLGTGLAETLTADLRKLKNVRVISRERTQKAAIRRDAGDSENSGLAETGRGLGARWLIAGSYQRAGNRLRITPRLIETSTGEVISTGKVDGDWDDVFSLQDSVATNLIQALELQVDSSAMERIVAPETKKVEAYELYARGRQKFHQLGKDSLEEARQCFEKAVGLDSKYQMAYSGLGATYAMRYIHRTDPDDLNRAVSYLEKALELDPDLGEPYPWLCYAYMRQGKVQQAVEAGRKGVRVQPDLVQAHYFLGAAHLVSNETDPEHFQDAARALLRATQVDPRWEPSWLCLGEIAFNAGDYAAAERFISRQMDFARSVDRLRQFIGGEMMMGYIRLRQQRRDEARRWFTESLKNLEGVDHMYREPFIALTACGLSGLNLREGRAEEALAEARRALRMVKEFPRMLGRHRVHSRADSAMAAACAALGDAARARELVRAAGERIDTIRAHPETWIWQASSWQLHHAQAVALARLGENDAALDQLERAVATGWRDAAWLATDPALRPLHELASFRTLLDYLRSIPPLNFELARSRPESGSAN